MPDAPSDVDAGETPSPEPAQTPIGEAGDVGSPAQAQSWIPFSPDDQGDVEPAAPVADAKPTTDAEAFPAVDPEPASEPEASADTNTGRAPDPDPEPAQALLVGTSAHVASLVDEILDPSRTAPVIVVTAKPSAGEPFVDADALAASVGEKASVWVLDDPDLTWSLTDALPPKLDVYGGAVRAYNTLEEGDEEPYPSDHPQWTVFDADEGDKVVRLITAYIDLVTATRLPAFGDTTTATVTTVRKAGAELELATGHPGFVSIGHLIQHGEVFHAADVLQKGQEVPVRVGAWNPHAGRLSVTMREFAPDPWQRLAEVYEPGMLVEGGVSAVRDFGAFVELLPGVEGLLHKSKIADEFVEYVDDYVREGDRITVRLLDLDPERQKAGVSLRDVPKGATAEPPASIFPGGPPWLPMPGQDIADDPEKAGAHAGTDDTSTPASDASTSAADVPASAAAAPAAGLPDPGYGAQLQALVGLVLEHGAGDDAALATTLRDALERAFTTFDATLDEVDTDDATDDPDEANAGPVTPAPDAAAITALRDAAGDLIDALRD